MTASVFRHDEHGRELFLPGLDSSGAAWPRMAMSLEVRGRTGWAAN